MLSELRSPMTPSWPAVQCHGLSIFTAELPMCIFICQMRMVQHVHCAHDKTLHIILLLCWHGARIILFENEIASRILLVKCKMFEFLIKPQEAGAALGMNAGCRLLCCDGIKSVILMCVLPAATQGWILWSTKNLSCPPNWQLANLPIFSTPHLSFSSRNWPYWSWILSIGKTLLFSAKNTF